MPKHLANYYLAVFLIGKFGKDSKKTSALFPLLNVLLPKSPPWLVLGLLDL